MSAPTTADEPILVLVPGAWMGAWIWDDLVHRLNRRGHDAVSLTLVGLEPGRPAEQTAAVRLEDHVRQTCDLVADMAPRRVDLVGHSYSGMVVGQVADRLPDVVRRSVQVGAFLPRDGRSLIDDWGPDADTRRAEYDQIHGDGMLWKPPPRDGLEQEPDLSDEQRNWLSTRFVPHPGRTVLDPASMSRPITEQCVTFIATAGTGSDPLDDLPPEFDNGTPDRWQLRAMHGGHWPMLTDPDTLLDHLTEAVDSSASP